MKDTVQHPSVIQSTVPQPTNSTPPIQILPLDVGNVIVQDSRNVVRAENVNFSVEFARSLATSRVVERTSSPTGV